MAAACASWSEPSRPDHIEVHAHTCTLGHAVLGLPWDPMDTHGHGAGRPMIKPGFSHSPGMLLDREADALVAVEWSTGQARFLGRAGTAALRQRSRAWWERPHGRVYMPPPRACALQSVEAVAVAVMCSAVGTGNTCTVSSFSSSGA